MLVLVEDSFHPSFFAKPKKLTIFESPITQLVCHQILHNLLFSHALGNMQSSQEHLKTISYAKFGGQTECIMGDSKIENKPLETVHIKSRSSPFYSFAQYIVYL